MFFLDGCTHYNKAINEMRQYFNSFANSQTAYGKSSDLGPNQLLSVNCTGDNPVQYPLHCFDDEPFSLRSHLLIYSDRRIYFHFYFFLISPFALTLSEFSLSTNFCAFHCILHGLDETRTSWPGYIHQVICSPSSNPSPNFLLVFVFHATASEIQKGPNLRV